MNRTASNQFSAHDRPVLPRLLNLRKRYTVQCDGPVSTFTIEGDDDLAMGFVRVDCPPPLLVDFCMCLVLSVKKHTDCDRRSSFDRAEFQSQVISESFAMAGGRRYNNQSNL